MAKYRPGDVVWVKIKRCPWWPAEVLDPQLCPLPANPNQTSFIAFVKFYNEEEYQVVTCDSDILPFMCPQHNELIRKGQNERRFSLSTKFQPAVVLAEQRVNDYSDGTLSRCSSSVSNFDANVDEESSSSDSELPEGLTLPDTNVKAVPAEKDAVWVKYRKYPYWPAVVQRVKKEKRLVIQFLGQDTDIKKRFYVRFSQKNVLPFSYSKRKEFEEIGKTLKEPLKTQFKNAVHDAEVYINKKALGSLAVEDLSDTDASFNMSLEVQSDTSRNCEAPPVKRRRLAVTGYSRRISKQPEARKQKLKARNQGVVEFIISDDMKKYLLQILKKERKSELHRKYQTSQGERSRLRHAGFGPIENEDQQDEITYKMLDWMREITGNTIVDVSYILDVWVPEAVVMALIKVKAYCRSKAWHMFWKGYKMTKAECQEIHNHLIEGDPHSLFVIK